jgi:hypothetical protein
MWKKEKKEWGVLAFLPFLLLTNVMLSNPFISGYKDRFLSVHFNIFLTVILIRGRIREFRGKFCTAASRLTISGGPKKPADL